MHEFLTTAQAAEKLGLKPRSIRLAVLSGRMRAVKAGRDWLISPADLAAFAARAETRGRKKKEETMLFAIDLRRGRDLVEHERFGTPREAAECWQKHRLGATWERGGPTMTLTASYRNRIFLRHRFGADADDMDFVPADHPGLEDAFVDGAVNHP
jgi:excisionase family DNA binding protein